MLSNPKLLKLWNNINNCEKRFLTPWRLIIIITSLVVIISNYYFADPLTLFSKILERLDAFNVINEYKQFAECSSPELSKTTSSNATISKDELERQAIIEIFTGCCWIALAVELVIYYILY